MAKAPAKTKKKATKKAPARKTAPKRKPAKKIASRTSRRKSPKITRALADRVLNHWLNDDDITLPQIAKKFGLTIDTAEAIVVLAPDDQYLGSDPLRSVH